MDEATKNPVTLMCKKHGEYIGEIAVFNFPGMKTMEIPSTCPLCEKEMDQTKWLEEEERGKRAAVLRLKSMNIDERFYDSTFDNFNAYNDELKRHLETCRAFAAKPDGKLVMIGENGNGKTHLAVSILKKLGGVIYTTYEIGVNLRQCYDGETREHEVFNELCTAPLLVIDEVEKVKDSEAKQHWMSHVIGKRYNKLLPVILIANGHTQKNCTAPVKPCQRCLEYHLENDVLSRVIEDGIIMTFSSGDYREKIRDARFGGAQ